MAPPCARFLAHQQSTPHPRTSEARNSGKGAREVTDRSQYSHLKSHQSSIWQPLIVGWPSFYALPAGGGARVIDNNEGIPAVASPCVECGPANPTDHDRFRGCHGVLDRAADGIDP